jgi:hypothetical protein
MCSNATVRKPLYPERSVNVYSVSVVKGGESQPYWLGPVTRTYAAWGAAGLEYLETVEWLPQTPFGGNQDAVFQTMGGTVDVEGF